MRLIMSSLTLLSFVLPGLAQAEDASMCKSLCTGNRQECRAKVPQMVDLDRTLRVENNEKNPMARAAALRQPETAEGRIRDRNEYESRRAERNGMCDDSYNRCVRGCAAPEPATGASAVLTPQGRQRAAGSGSGTGSR